MYLYTEYLSYDQRSLLQLCKLINKIPSIILYKIIICFVSDGNKCLLTKWHQQVFVTGTGTLED